jgi:mono/diheme cytochrome c family protein
MNTAALSFLRPGENAPYATILLDDPEHGAANPWAVVVSADGSTLVVSHAGTHELSLIPIAPLLEKIRKAPDRPSLAFHLSFLYGLRTRVKTGGLGTRALAVLPSGVVSADRFSDSLCLTRGGASDPISKRYLLRPEVVMSPAQRGELAFNDATLCVQQWQSCASCHPDGRVDALNWDLLNDGIGNPKNARSLLFAHRRSPVMSHGIRATAEVAVRSGIRNILFTVQPEETAKSLDAYLKSMEPVPSPFLENGALSAKARRGKEVFASREAACFSCHPAPLYTDMKLHDVGTRGPHDKDAQFLTPTLIEVWRTAPYLHDGRSATMKDALDVGVEHGKNVRRLSPEDRDALIEYVMSL